MGEGLRILQDKIAAYRRRYYVNLFVRGFIFTGISITGYFLLAALAEHSLWLSSWARLTVILLFFAIVGFCIYRFLGKPIQWWLSGRGLEDEDVARHIGRKFPNIADRLLNTLQLSRDSSDLARASILRRSDEFRGVAFEETIRIDQNKRYLRFWWPLLAVIGLIFIFNQSILTNSTRRIVHFDEQFSPEPPFRFDLKNTSLVAYYNEDFLLTLGLTGDAIPEAVYVVTDGRELKMQSTGAGMFTYSFEKLQREITLQFKAGGFFSGKYTITVMVRPELTTLNIQLRFPGYLNRQPQRQLNQGNLEIPEGTQVTWEIGAQHTSTSVLQMGTAGPSFNMKHVGDQTFTHNMMVQEPGSYTITLQHDSIRNREPIQYTIDVIKDQYPHIAVQHFRDSILYREILLSGDISDDYGFSRLALQYEVVRSGAPAGSVNHLSLPIQAVPQQQRFYHRWSLDSLHLAPGDQVNYYIQVWDNDQVNGAKSARTAAFSFMLPGKEAMRQEVSKGEQTAERQLDQSVDKARSLRQSIEEMSQKLKGKQQLDWQDKSMLEQIIQQKKELEKVVEKLKEENKMLDLKRENLTEQDDRIREKAEQIQKLMDELLDEETKKLFKQLEDLMKEKSDPDQLRKMLDQLNRKELNLEKELDRMQELFKQFKYETQLERNTEELSGFIQRQEDLQKQTESLSRQDGPQKESGSEKLAQEQQKLNQDMKDWRKSMEELDKLKEELKEPGDLPSAEEQKSVEEEQKKSEAELKEKNPKKASENQKQAAGQMKQMQQKMQSMQNSMDMEMDQANLELLRHILHGLVKLSFDEESILKEYNAIHASDPRNVALSQLQIKVQDDSKVLEDSLLSLSKKDAMISAVVTREVGDLNDHLSRTTEFIKDRKKSNASTEMQLSMTGINNLALLLKDHYDMMMDMMANSSPGSKKGKKKQQSISQMQQMLNQQIEQMKNGQGKPGSREYSEQLAKMAAEQERIRRALQELQEKMKGSDGKMPGGDLPGKMEETEMDLVNKRITEQTIKRQKEILTRLLEAEKSMREQDQEEERKGETAKEYENQMPRAFEEYLKLKEKEVELLRTVPPRLYPYYKKEVNEYFKRIGTKD